MTESPARDPRLDVDTRLQTLAQSPLPEHAAVYRAVQEDLQAALSEIDS